MSDVSASRCILQYFNSLPPTLLLLSVSPYQVLRSILDAIVDLNLSFINLQQERRVVRNLFRYKVCTAIYYQYTKDIINKLEYKFKVRRDMCIYVGVCVCAWVYRVASTSRQEKLRLSCRQHVINSNKSFHVFFSVSLFLLQTLLFSLRVARIVRAAERAQAVGWHGQRPQPPRRRFVSHKSPATRPGARKNNGKCNKSRD